MAVYRALAELEGADSKRRGLALGVFDGVHRGHAKILSSLADSVEREGLESAMVLTFHPHPLALLAPQRAPRLILGLEERLAALQHRGIGEILVLPFTPELAATPYERFTREILLGSLGMRHLVVGYDFRLGRDRDGSAASMASLGEELGFRVEVVSPCYQNGRIVSSTRIRADLEAGELAAVRGALGHSYPLTGQVVRGRGDGRRLAFPTANLALEDRDKLLPPPGVYLVGLQFDGRLLHGLLNLGWAPTLRGRFLPEVHLLDFEGDLYGRRLQLELLQRLREEKRFSSRAALAAQIHRDVARARKILAAAGPAGKGQPAAGD